MQRVTSQEYCYKRKGRSEAIVGWVFCSREIVEVHFHGDAH